MEAFAADPQGVAAQYAEGTEQRPARDPNAAAEDAMLAALDAAVEKKNAPAMACAWRAALLRRRLRYAEAVAMLERSKLTAAFALTWRGEARLQTGDLAGGLRDLKAALKRRDAAAWNWAWTGRIALTLLKDRGALKYLDRAISLEPRWPLARVWRGEARRHLGFRQGMLADFSAAEKLGLDDYWRVMVLGWRALDHVRAGFLKEGARDLAEARRRMPGYALWPCGLAQAARKDGRLRDWIELFDAAAVLGPRYIREAESWDAEKTAAALRDLDSALKDEPKLACALRWRGFLRARSGDPKNAAADLARACRLEPKSHAAWLWQAQALAAAGDFSPACACVERALALEPASIEALLTLARLETARGRTAEALAAYGRAEAADPRCTPVYSERGCLRLTLGRFKEAAEDLALAVSIDSRDAERFVDLAEARLRLGDAAGAKQALERARKLDSGRALEREKRWTAFREKTGSSQS